MKRLSLAAISLILLVSTDAIAKVTPVEGGYNVSYWVNLHSGTSNGNDIQDVMVFEWNDSEFSADGPYTISARGRTVLSHVIGFEPSHALVLGWGAAIPGVGDEKDHLFMLSNSFFMRQATGNKWSAVFPGVPPEPRTGHNAMIGLVQDAAAGDADALASIRSWIEREATGAAFDPDGGFRTIEWSVAQPIDVVVPVPLMPPTGYLLLILVMLGATALYLRRTA